MAAYATPLASADSRTATWQKSFGYCGERTVEAFMERVGKEYPPASRTGGKAPIMASRRSRQSNIAASYGRRTGRRRGLVMFTKPLSLLRSGTGSIAGEPPKATAGRGAIAT